MKKQVVSASTIILCIIFFFFFNGSFCSDPFYESCVPKDCGDGRNVSYPFYIQGLQSPFCAYPSFKLRCNINGSSVIRISGNNYVVKHIDYNNRSMRLVTAPDITCLSEITNLTLDPGRFVLDEVSTAKLIFLTNCSRKLPANLARYRVGSCDGSTDQLVMLENDGNLGMGKEVCTQVVVAPAEVQTGGRREVVDGGNYAEVVERGFRVWWMPLVSDCGVCERSGGKCGFNTTLFEFQCFCPSGPHTVRCNTGGKQKRMVLVTALSAGVGTLLAVIIFCLVRKFKWRTKTADHMNVENFLKNHEFLAPKRYSYSQVKKMTKSFKVKLGHGGFGTVYKGALSNGNLVAVKVLNKLKGNGEDFINEVASVGRTSHVNIVTLVGFCCDDHQRALIYEFMSNGSLERFIYDKDSSSDHSQLGWEKLNEIAIGIARGLEYLHNGCNTRILHFDIKPHNILLDQDLCPKISDFGLAKLFHEKSMISVSRVRGTQGYIAPELVSMNFGQVSHKSDVFSYGMMILEMVGGRKNIEPEVDHISEIYFPRWIYKKIQLDEEQLGLHGIVSDSQDEMARKMIIVGLWCIQINPLSRPTITKVLDMLEGDLASLEIPPKPYLSSLSRSTSTD